MIQYAKKNKELIFKIINKRINDNMDTQINQVLIYEAYLTDYGVSIENVSFRCEWLYSLNLAIQYFEEVEDYESCCEIRDTIKRLKDKNNVLSLGYDRQGTD